MPNVYKQLILIIHSFSSLNDFWPQEIEKHFRKEVEAFQYTGDIVSLSMEDLGVEKVKNLVESLDPSLVLLTNEPACISFVEYFRQKTTPVIFASIPKKVESLSWLKPEHKDITGIVEKIDISKAVELLENLTQKKIKKVGILVGGPKNPMMDLALLMEEELRGKAKTIVKRTTFANEWKKELLALENSDCDVLVPLLPFNMAESKESSKLASWKDLNDFRVSHTKKPTTGIFWPSADLKTLTTNTLNPGGIGSQAARIAYKYIVKKIPLSQIPITHSRFHGLSIDEHEAERLNIAIDWKVAAHVKIF